MNAKSNTCTRCGIFTELAPANISKKTKERLYRSWCVPCEKERKAKWVQDNLEYVLEKTKKYQKENQDQVKQTKQNWARKNPEYAAQYSKQWKLNNRKRVRAEISARRKRLQQHTPIWATRQEIVAFYENCPEGFHVDHIIPLKGKLVSGLHTLANLQYLPAKENMSKGNKYEIDG